MEKMGILIFLALVAVTYSAPTLERPYGAHLPRLVGDRGYKFNQAFLQKQENCGNGCSGHGDCVDGKCVCDELRNGTYCEKALCLRNCGNHGFCDEGICVCNKGWTGDDCMTDTCPGHCHMHGTCIDGKCDCDPGWREAGCNIAIAGLEQFGALPLYGKPFLNKISNRSTAVRIPPSRIDDGGLFVKGTLNVTVNKTCSEQRNFRYPQSTGSELNAETRSLEVEYYGDFVVSNTPENCTAFVFDAEYDDDTEFTDTLGTYEPEDSTMPVEQNAPTPTPEPAAPGSNQTCLNNCSGHGQCVDGKCECDMPYFGPCCCKVRPGLGATMRARLAKTDPLNEVDPESVYAEKVNRPGVYDKWSFNESNMLRSMLQDDRYLKPTYDGNDVINLIEVGVWAPETYVCCT